MIQEHAAEVVIITLFFTKAVSQKKEMKKWICVKPFGLKEEKTEDLMKLCLQNCDCKTNIIITFYSRITSENCEGKFQLIKDDITKENTKMRELIPPKL